MVLAFKDWLKKVKDIYIEWAVALLWSFIVDLVCNNSINKSYLFNAELFN